jgi:hypothetical protein
MFSTIGQSGPSQQQWARYSNAPHNNQALLTCDNQVHISHGRSSKLTTESKAASACMGLLP